MNMEGYVKKASQLFVTEACLEEYFQHFNFLDGECFKATLSKSLGLGIIIGSLLVKVPQILKILNSRSSQGINLFSVLLDLFAITATGSYSYISKFPFSAWGDAVFLAVQTVTIAFLVFYYSSGVQKSVSFLVAYLAIIASVVLEIASIKILWLAQASNIPVVLISKFMQAYTNYSNGSTGQLSAVTVLMLFFGSLARIFTSFQETGDSTMIIMYICSTAANAVIVLQLIYYWNVTEKKTSQIKKKK